MKVSSSGKTRRLPPRDPKGGRPTREMAERLAAHILETALDQFIVHGVDGANMDDIAAAANVSKRTLYARYGSKNGLLVAAAEYGTAKHLRSVVAGIQTGSIRDRILWVARRILDIAVSPKVVGLETLINWVVSRKLGGTGPDRAIGSNASINLIQCLLEEADLADEKEDAPFLAAFLYDALVTVPRTRILVRRDLENAPKAKSAYLEQTMDLIARAVPLLSR
ncbi:hypothetical protein AL00_02030 [Sphingobium indicum F2]|uniref:HTH tetR-type domain-containing protein n=2 Tax=Sphingobium indicum TaxID=332055 RepID=A0A8E0WVV4_9SPHN|nr:TetR/AcrR family transcriptional regulator [Sphingobium indicum]KER38130.1 hypothetical protein AL00_02030 [Sphingobium indicum F2]